MSDTTTEQLSLVEVEEASESLTIREAARLLGYHRRTVQKKLKEGALTRAPDGGVDIASLTRYREAPRPARKQPPRRPSRQNPDKALAVAQAQVRLLQDEVKWLRAELKTYKAREADLLAIMKTHAQRPAPPRQHRTPIPGTLLDRVYQHLRASPRPRRVWQVQQALGLPLSPGRELGRLVERHLARRIKPGLFEALGSVKRGPHEKPAPVLRLFERVLQIIQEVGQPISAAEIQARLQSKRRVSQELSRLVTDKKIERLPDTRPPLYVACGRKEEVS